MDCHLHCSTIPHLLSKNPTGKPQLGARLLSKRVRTRPVRALAVAKPKTDSYNVAIKTLDECKIGFSGYNLEYNANGGKGAGHGTRLSDRDLSDSVVVSFDPKTVYIPPVTSATTKMYGWPMPHFLKIEIVPEVLQGSINEESGKAPPIIVEIVLTSDESLGKRGSAKGKRRGKDGRCRLVGIATLGPLKDGYMDALLGLPAECVTEMNAIIYFN
ncbi:hypothetical protein AKJ16_DCAP25525 [Drosera capensis]